MGHEIRLHIDGVVSDVTGDYHAVDDFRRGEVLFDLSRAASWSSPDSAWLPPKGSPVRSWRFAGLATTGRVIGQVFFDPRVESP